MRHYSIILLSLSLNYGRCYVYLCDFHCSRKVHTLLEINILLYELFILLDI